MDEYKPINVHGILLTAVHDGGTGEEYWGLLFTLCHSTEWHRQLYMYDHRRADCKDSAICERKKMQFILIGKVDNISIKLVA